MVDEYQSPSSEDPSETSPDEGGLETDAAETIETISDVSDDLAVNAYDAMAAMDSEGAAALREEWGEAFETNLLAAQAAASSVADESLIALLAESGLGNDPTIIRAAAKIGHLIVDQAGEIAPRRGISRIPALESQLDEIARSPDYWSDAVQRRVRDLHLKLYGNSTIGVHRKIGDAGSR